MCITFLIKLHQLSVTLVIVDDDDNNLLTMNIAEWVYVDKIANNTHLGTLIPVMINLPQKISGPSQSFSISKDKTSVLRLLTLV
jgi:hypothetical protein